MVFWNSGHPFALMTCGPAADDFAIKKGNTHGSSPALQSLLRLDVQATEMLYGAAGKLVGMGSILPSAITLARRYI